MLRKPRVPGLVAPSPRKAWVERSSVQGLGFEDGAEEGKLQCRDPGLENSHGRVTSLSLERGLRPRGQSRRGA